MRVRPFARLLVPCLLPLVLLSGCMWSVRNEGFTPTGPNAFLYSARTNTVMTENDDGTAERLRRQWLADALQAHSMCGDGYVVDTRRFVSNVDGRFGNGGEIVYSGRCLQEPPPPRAVPIPGRGERG
jgi:hypothetical protein